MNPHLVSNLAYYIGAVSLNPCHPHTDQRTQFLLLINRKANNRGLWLFVSVTLETVEQTDVMLHYTTLRGPGSQRDRAGTRWRRIAVAIRKGGSDGAVCGRIQDNARRGLDVKRVVMLRGMGLHGGQYFNCGTFKDEG